MTVADLINQLSKLDPSAVVVMSRDSEGNDFSPLDSLSPGTYIPETTWHGEFYEVTDGETSSKEVAAVALWPVN